MSSEERRHSDQGEPLEADHRRRTRSGPQEALIDIAGQPGRRNEQEGGGGREDDRHRPREQQAAGERRQPLAGEFEQHRLGGAAIEARPAAEGGVIPVARRRKHRRGVNQHLDQDDPDDHPQHRLPRRRLRPGGVELLVHAALAEQEQHGGQEEADRRRQTQPAGEGEVGLRQHRREPGGPAGAEEGERGGDQDAHDDDHPVHHIEGDDRDQPRRSPRTR